MSIELSTYLVKKTEKSQTAVQSHVQASWQTQSFLYFFAVVLGGFRVGKSIALLDPILSKGSRTSFGKRPFSNFSKNVKRFNCHMSHRKRDDKNECIINFMIICTHSFKCTVFLKKVKDVILRFDKDFEAKRFAHMQFIIMMMKKTCSDQKKLLQRTFISIKCSYFANKLTF